eukprot:CAMPEP_0198201178 /NCGR_PEP_ID=MMETSP1445-20131203/3950_1 /TAXON_ID=36898 /ORGANISM="Pyramimonas sp., Strain CCMP2087" /LENGTH=268 /DNA_ID=CAMNT_0043871381 /DNA_START=471 /DNA_END=1277 /DNA_ORIENTATION=+
MGFLRVPRIHWPLMVYVLCTVTQGAFLMFSRSPDGIPHPTHPHKVLDKFTADLQTSGLLEWLSEDADDDFDIKPQNQAEPAKAAKEKAQPGGNSKRKLLAHAEKPKNKNEAAVIQSLRAALDTCHRQAGKALPVNAKKNMEALLKQSASFIDQAQVRADVNAKSRKNSKYHQKKVGLESTKEEIQHDLRNAKDDISAEKREKDHINSLASLQATIDYYRGIRNIGAPASGLSSFRSSAGDVASLNNAEPTLPEHIATLNQDGGDRDRK